jgi:hypothetical protein
MTFEYLFARSVKVLLCDKMMISLKGKVNQSSIRTKIDTYLRYPYLEKNTGNKFLD